MIMKILCLALLAVLWWAALWFVLPLQWLQGTLASFVAVHLAPPLLPVAAWWAGKRAGVWGVAKAKARTDRREAAEKDVAQAAAKTAHQAALEQRRAHLECRAVWAALARLPDWVGATQCTLLEQAPKPLLGIGREAALLPSLQQVFKEAFEQCEALVWLPVMLAADDPAQLGWIEQAWHQAVMDNGIERFPSPPDCAVLPGHGEIPDRLLALFESDPALPAVILVGMASPLADAMQQTPDSGPGHAVTALLLSRPGLIAPDEAQIACASEDKAHDPFMPYWEREKLRGLNQAFSQWGKMPLTMASTFLETLLPIATLHRTSPIHQPASRQKALTQQFHEAIREALIHAGIWELPFEEGEPGGEQAHPEEPEPLELGWCVHNADPDFLGALVCALSSVGCELDPIKEASDVVEEHGDVGEARTTLMLAEALIRAAQRQQPVLMSELDENISIGFVRPASPNAPADVSTLDPLQARV